MLVRLQKYIADQGVCSRRKAEELIRLEKVKLNGKVVSEMGIKIDPKIDKVQIIGEAPPKQNNTTVYIALNKPVDYISSASNKQGASVTDLLTKENNIGRDKRELKQRVYPVGRLDKDSEGLVILTNDGELTNLLTHPRYEHEKEYEVTIDSPLSKDAKKVLTKGMNIDDHLVKGIRIVSEFNKGKRAIITVILEEGKNRQIRKMFGLLGYHVISLRRIRVGNFKLGTIPVGKWKQISKYNIME